MAFTSVDNDSFHDFLQSSQSTIFLKLFKCFFTVANQLENGLERRNEAPFVFDMPFITDLITSIGVKVVLQLVKAVLKPLYQHLYIFTAP